MRVRALALLFIVCLIIGGCSEKKNNLQVKPLENSNIINGETGTNKEINNESKENSDNYINNLEYKNGNRFFKCEVKPTISTEEVVLEILKIGITDEYDKFINLYVKSESVDNFPELYKENLAKGLYTEEMTIHSLKKIAKEQYTNPDSGKSYYGYMDNVTKLKPSDIEVIEVNYTVKLTDEYNKIAQWGNGNWVRYYVLVKQGEETSWRVADIYGHM